MQSRGNVVRERATRTVPTVDSARSRSGKLWSNRDAVITWTLIDYIPEVQNHSKIGPGTSYLRVGVAVFVVISLSPYTDTWEGLVVLVGSAISSHC